MQTLRSYLTPESLLGAGKALLTVAAAAALLLLIGRDTLGVAVVALLLLVPVGWSTTRWGPLAGSVAAVAAALTFNFFFIPPYYTFFIGSLEGWLVFAIFFAVAVVMVDRIQTGLARAQASERDATFMYELSAALAGVRTQIGGGAHCGPPASANVPGPAGAHGGPSGRPGAERGGQRTHRALGRSRRPGAADRVIPILNDWGLVGSIQIWRGPLALPPAGEPPAAQLRLASWAGARTHPPGRGQKRSLRLAANWLGRSNRIEKSVP